MKKEQRIKVLRVKPNLPPDIIYLNNGLHDLQVAVGGLIEFVYIEKGVCLLLNEEGKLKGLMPNRRLGQDILVGVFYVIGSDDSSGDLISLSEKQISNYTKRFYLSELIKPEEVQDTIRIKFYSL